MVANAFFKAKTHGACESFNREGTTHQIDHAIVPRNSMSVIENCQVHDETAARSDHSDAKTTLRSRAPKKKQKQKRA